MSRFDLDAAIQAWADLAIKEHCVDTQHVDELKDHLYCEVESRVAAGMSSEVAFSCAVDNLRQHPLLDAKYKSKSRLFNKLIELECGKTASPGEYRRGRLLVTQSLLWAAAMLGTAILVGDHPNAGHVTILVMVPLAMLSILTLPKARID